MSSVLFHRLYDQYSGGQQKVLDYFGHCLAKDDYHPSIYWDPASLSLVDTPWGQHSDHFCRDFNPANADVMFLAGMDWQVYLKWPTPRNQPVLNLLQHVRHAEPGQDVHAFLKERAIRICVSEEVKTAVDETGLANGPVFSIPNGLDVSSIAQHRMPHSLNSVFILGNKQPEIARELEKRLSNDAISMICYADHVSRLSVHRAMAQSEIIILLPHATEGFYLPALEAMALGKIVIVPDCVGNRSFCTHNQNCLMPEANVESILGTYHEARKIIKEDQHSRFSEAANLTLANHSLDRERLAFYTLLNDLDQIW